MTPRPRITLSGIGKTVAIAIAATLFVVAGGVAPVSAAATYSISGTVTLGSSSTTAGSGEVSVLFTPVGQTHQPADHVETNADGFFVIPSLPNGSYDLYYQYNGTSNYTSGWHQEDPLATVPTHPVVIAGANISPRIFSLGTKRSVTGTISLGTASVTAAAGEVSVRYQFYYGGEWSAESAGVITDANGFFSIPNLVDGGQYRLHYVYLGSGAFQSVYTGYLGFGASSIFGLFSGTAVQSATLPVSGSFSGHVYLGTSAVPAGAGSVTVSIELCNVPVVGECTALTSGTTDASGYYFIGGLNAGTYRAKYTYSGTNFVGVTVPASPYFDAGRPTVTAGAVTRDVTIAPAYSVTGHVYLGSTARSAVANEVVVTFTPTGGIALTPVPTDASGNYSVVGLSAGNYMVEYQYAAASAEFPSYKRPGTLQVAADASAADVTLPAWNVLRGTVVRSSTLAALSGVNVYAGRFDLNTGEYLDVTETTSGADGTYRFDKLLDGTYSVYFEAPGYSKQTWDGLSYYYQDDQFDLVGGAVKTGVNARMFLTSSISGTVAGAGMTGSQLSYVQSTLSVWDGSSEEWVEVADIPIAGNGTYSITGLFPDDYLVDFFYDGPLGVAVDYSLITVGEGQSKRFNPTLNAVVPLSIGELIKGSSPTVYLVNGYDELVPLAAFSSATDAGLSSAYRTVPDSLISSFDIAATPLSNVISCVGQTYVSSGGKLWAVDGSNLATVASLPKTALFDALCIALPKSSGVLYGPIYLTAPTGGLVYRVSAGVKRPVVGSLYATSYFAPPAMARIPDVVLPVGNYFLTQIPAGSSYLEPGSLVKTASSPTVYLVDGPDKLVPLASMDTARDLGFPTWNLLTVAQADFHDRTVTSPLQYLITCDGSWPIMGAHYRYGGPMGSIAGPFSINVIPSQVTGLPTSELSWSTCSAIGGTPNPSSSKLFVKSLNGPTLYYLNNGMKQRMLTMDAAYEIAGTTSIVIANVTDAFLGSIPESATPLTTGMLVKAASSPTVYLVDDATHVVPVRTFDSITELGLPTTVVTVSPATFAGVTIASSPLSNFIMCSASYYYAAGRALNLTDSTTVGASPVTALSTGLCAALAKNTATAGNPLFIKSPSAPTVYYMTAGQKKAIGSWASLVRLAGANPIVIVTLNAAFIAAVPSGPDVVEVGSLVKSAASPTIYLVSGDNSLVPVRTFESIAELGLSQAYITVSAATISGMTVDSAPLSNVVICGSESWLAAGGKLTRITATTNGPLEPTALSSALCALLLRNAGTLSDPVFIKSPAAPTVYALSNGVKRSIGQWASVVRLAGSNPVVIVTVNAAFLATVPTGPDVLETGALVKSATAPTVYMVDGSGGLIPLASFQSASDLGLSTAYATVSNETISGSTISSTPLGTLVSCGGELWIAGQGKLWKTTTASTGALAAQALATTLCAVIPKSAVTLSTPSLIKSTTSPTIYALQGGVKKAVGSMATVMTITAGAGTYVTTNPSFIASIPNGPAIP